MHESPPTTSASKQTSASKLSPEDNERIFKAAKEYCATVPNACECVPFTRGAQYATEFERRPSPQQQPDTEISKFNPYTSLNHGRKEAWLEGAKWANERASQPDELSKAQDELWQELRAIIAPGSSRFSPEMFNELRRRFNLSVKGQPDELSKAQARIRELEEQREKMLDLLVRVSGLEMYTDQTKSLVMRHLHEFLDANKNLL